MNAIACDIDTKPATIFASGARTTAASKNFARTGARLAEQRCCPFCDSIIYSRRHKLCGVCAQELPQEFLFDPGQTENIKSLLREEQQRHRAWMQRFNFAN